MAILAEESTISAGHKEFSMFKLFNDESADETVSSTVEIQNADALTLFVESSAGVSGGVVQLQTAVSSAGPWYAAGTVTTNAASTAFVDSVQLGEAGLPAKYARARIETAVAGGTVDVYLIVQR